MKTGVAAYLEKNFEVVKILRKTDKGEVKLAQSRETGTLVIIKKINFIGLPYRLLKNNPHPLFAKIFKCAEDFSDTVIVEEFIQGESLLERLKVKKFFTEDETLKILLQLCDGLKFLHELGIIHRDIKPSNLILQTGGIVRLIDFDAARVVKPDKDTDTLSLGTKGYAPPEQYGYGQTDSRSDIYALGVTAKEMLGSNYHGRFEKILSKCTEIDPKNRWQSVDELKNALTYQKNFFPPKTFRRLKFAVIFFVTFIVTFLFYNNSPDSSNSKLPQKISEPEVKEKIVKTEIKPPPKVEEKFQFPEIIMPQAPIVPPNQNVEIPNIEVPIIEIPVPAPKVEEKIIVQRFQKEYALNPENLNYVKAEYFLDGARIQGWTDDFDFDIANVKPADLYEISFDEWQTWTKLSADSPARIFPPSIIEVFVKNFSDKILTDVKLEVIFHNVHRVETKILRGVNLSPNQETHFEIPLNQFCVDNPNYKIVNAVFDGIQLKLSGNGAEIHGSNAEVLFHFNQR